MRIFTLRRMLGLTAIGVAYVHGKRGGDATVASISDTLQYVWKQVAERLGLDKRTSARPMPHRTGSASSTSASSSGSSGSVGSGSSAKMPNGLERNPRPQGGQG